MYFVLTGLLTHGDLDERALDALKEFPADGGVAVLKEFKESNLEHVSNKSAYLCGVMKTYRQKNRAQAPAEAASAKKPGPDEAKLKVCSGSTRVKAPIKKFSGPVSKVSACTWEHQTFFFRKYYREQGSALDVTTGQRKYGGPPPGWDKPQPGAGHEVRFQSALFCSINLAVALTFVFLSFPIKISCFAGILWEDSKRCLWRRVSATVWKMWRYMGPAVNDGSTHRAQQRILFCHISR